MESDKETPQCSSDISAPPSPNQPSVRPILMFKRLSESGKAPSKATPGSAGWDLYSASNHVINPGKRELVQLDIALKIPKGYYGRIAPRSGLGLKFGIHVGAGVIDSDYVGAVAVLLFNFGDKPFKIRKGDRIAQLLIEKICTSKKIVEVSDLESTSRGSGGFGSTGI